MNDDSYNEQDWDEINAIKATFARLDPLALAVSVGVVCGALLLGATCVLVFVGAPEGISVGTHLKLLAQFLPGYDVSVAGAFVGLIYGFTIGAVLGLFLAAMWNITHHIYALGIAARGLFERGLE